MTSVDLPREKGAPPSATRTLHAILRATFNAFPDTFKDLVLPSRPPLIASRTRTAQLLTQFEVIRSTSPQRLEIARFVTDTIQRSFVVSGNTKTTTLERVCTEPAVALQFVERPPFTEKAAEADARTPDPHAGIASNLSAVIDGLARDELISAEATAALEQVLQQPSGGGGASLDLTHERFVLVGGTAELAPLSFLLGAGAQVLTTHTSEEGLERSAAADIAYAGSRRGRLFMVPGGVNLLASPAEFSESAIGFADGQRVHVGAFAYRGGQGQEWRLTAAMDGIIRRLRRAGALASVTYYLSPSVVTEVSPATALEALERLSRERTFGRIVARALSGNTLFRPNIITSGSRFWCQSHIPRQGVSYQSGNLFGKNFPAEIQNATNALAGDQHTIRVSATVAPITRTRSTDLPEAKAAFSELSQLRIEVFEPPLARRLMYLLMLRNLFGSSYSVSNRFDQQIHGGVFTNAWALDSVLKLGYLKALAHGSALRSPL